MDGRKQNNHNLRQGNAYTFWAVCAVLILFLGLLGDYVSAAVDDDLKKQIETLDEKYQKSKQKIEENKKKLREKEKEKKEVEKRLNSAEKDIKNINNDIISIKNKERRLEREIDNSRSQLSSTENHLKSKADSYAARLRSMYIRQRVSPLGLFLSGASMSSILRGIRVFTAMAREDIKVLDEIDSQKQTIESAMSTLSNARKAQRALENRKKSDLLSLEKKKDERKKWLDRIIEDTQLTLEEIQKNEREKAAIEAELAEVQRKIDSQVKRKKFVDNIPEEVKKYNFGGRKGVLPWPAAGQVLSQFGLVTDPKTKTKTRNRGIEIAAHFGDPVHAIGTGIVMQTMYMRGYGNLVWLFHSPHYYTIYAHLTDIFVEMGDIVQEGDVLGSAGSSGLFDDKEARLLVEIINGKNPENPLEWLVPDKKRLSRR